MASMMTFTLEHIFLTMHAYYAYGFGKRKSALRFKAMSTFSWLVFGSAPKASVTLALSNGLKTRIINWYVVAAISTIRRGLRVELAILVRPEQVVPDLGQHLP
jgi:hypothetical protein